MKTTIAIDRAGRLVIPKGIRERMHLREGSRLCVELHGDRIELTPEPTTSKIVRGKDGLRVIAGWEGFDAGKAVLEARDEQLDRLVGQPRESL